MKFSPIESGKEEHDGMDGDWDTIIRINCQRRRRIGGKKFGMEVEWQLKSHNIGKNRLSEILMRKWAFMRSLEKVDFFPGGELWNQNKSRRKSQ